MTDLIPRRLRSLVRARAQGRCEYCLLHEEDAWFSHEPDHIIAIKHRGRTTADNLAWTCLTCNRHKGSDISSIDMETGRLVRLFNPRRDWWPRHFRLSGGRIVPKTAVGRVTEYLLQMNWPEQVLRRQELIAEGRYPR